MKPARRLLCLGTALAGLAVVALGAAMACGGSERDPEAESPQVVRPDVAGPGCAAQGDEAAPRPEWLRLRLSEDEIERRKAVPALLAERKATIEALLSVVNAPARPNEEFYGTTSRNYAIEALGKLRLRKPFRHSSSGLPTARTNL